MMTLIMLEYMKNVYGVEKFGSSYAPTTHPPFIRDTKDSISIFTLLTESTIKVYLSKISSRNIYKERSIDVWKKKFQ